MQIWKFVDIFGFTWKIHRRFHIIIIVFEMCGFSISKMFFYKHTEIEYLEKNWFFLRKIQTPRENDSINLWIFKSKLIYFWKNSLLLREKRWKHNIYDMYNMYNKKLFLLIWRHIYIASGENVKTYTQTLKEQSFLSKNNSMKQKTDRGYKKKYSCSPSQSISRLFYFFKWNGTRLLPETECKNWLRT